MIRRPLLLFAIAMINGIATWMWTNSIAAVFGGFIFAAALLVIACRRSALPRFLAAGMLLFFLWGALEAAYIQHRDQQRFLEFAGRQVTLRGSVGSEPEVQDEKVSCVVSVDEIISAEGTKKVSGKILFTALKEGMPDHFHFGSAIQIRGTLNIPKGRRNPGGFDYRQYLLKSGVSASVFAPADDIEITEDIHGHVLKMTGLAIRDRIVETINQCLPSEQAGLLNGMLIGYRDGLSKEVQTAFSDAGLSHIMAVSGMNIAFIVAPLVFLFKRFRIRQVIANLLIISTLVLFVFVTGFSPSVVRAAVMAVVVLTGQLLQRESDVLTSLSFAALLLLIFQPSMLMDIGFQLSFAATLSLILFYKRIRQLLTFRYLPKFLSDLLAVTLAAQAGVLPVTAYYFNKVSVISVLTNILVVPLTGVITVLGFLTAIAGQVSIGLAQILGWINYSLLSFILWITKTSAAIPWAVLRVVTPPLLLILFYYIVVLYALWIRPKYNMKLNLRVLAPVAGIAAAALFLYFLWPRGLEVVFLDVGQFY